MTFKHRALLQSFLKLHIELGFNSLTKLFYLLHTDSWILPAQLTT